MCRDNALGAWPVSRLSRSQLSVTSVSSCEKSPGGQARPGYSGHHISRRERQPWGNQLVAGLGSQFRPIAPKNMGGCGPGNSRSAPTKSNQIKPFNRSDGWELSLIVDNCRSAPANLPRLVAFFLRSLRSLRQKPRIRVNSRTTFRAAINSRGETNSWRAWVCISRQRSSSLGETNWQALGTPPNSGLFRVIPGYSGLSPQKHGGEGGSVRAEN